MKLKYITVQSSFFALLILTSPVLWAFDSGSTGADGALNVIVDTEIQLPADGVLNYTTVTVATGTTLTFAKNTTNTPVIILASGDVTIDGTISLDGGHSTDVGAAGDGNLGDDGIPGVGGPGGFDGGRGGIAGDTNTERQAGAGLGPGGGQGSDVIYVFLSPDENGCSAPAGAFGANASDLNGHCQTGVNFIAGDSYGSETLLPLIGGSGGGGASGGLSFGGSGGGGGGGAILIASSGTVTVSGSIFARGGNSGNTAGAGRGGEGGGGAGGAVRIIATTIAGNGTISAAGGVDGTGGQTNGGDGTVGRIRLEAENFLRTSSTTPAYSFAAPGDVFVAGMPTLTITSVAGVTAPANPTGNADIVLPETTPNPVTVDFATTDVPLGNTIELTLTPAFGDIATATSPAIAGTEANGTASVDITMPDGANVLTAEVSFTVVADAVNYEDYSRYADGEPVERIILRAGIGPQMASTTTFITKSGKEYTWPSNTVALPN